MRIFLHRIRRFFLQQERILKAILHIISAVSVMAAYAVEVDMIDSIFWTWVIFVVLGISVFGNLLLSINTNIYPSRRLANKFITTILNSACRSIDRGSPSEFRANVFMPIDKQETVLENKYKSTNMVDGPDENISFRVYQGCVGHAWGNKKPMWADLTLDEVEGGATWGMTHDQIEMTKGLKSIYAYPIKHPQDGRNIIGVLSFDTKEPPSDFPNGDDYYSQNASSTSKSIAQFLLDLGQILPIKKTDS